MAYRRGAIRECFEESGILLAKRHGCSNLIVLDEDYNETIRRRIHSNEVTFESFLDSIDSNADTDGLIPFTRWITPANLAKRFTTQMYIYFLPIATTPAGEFGSTTSSVYKSEAVSHVPTSDGGLEHTSAHFLPPAEWIRLAQAGEVILFPPQFFLLHLVNEAFSQADTSFEAPRMSDADTSPAKLTRDRETLRAFVHSGDPHWTEKCISPTAVTLRSADGRAALGLEKPGREVESTDRKGDQDHVVLVEWRKEGPRRLEIAFKRDLLREQRESQDTQMKL
ncbi:hypothetical protein MMC25_003116 [Agyrium rufum]|nr:hypothetical protein [Agyrium rufum]